MKKLICMTLLMAVAAGVPVVSASAPCAKTNGSSLKHTAVPAKLKKVSATSRSQHASTGNPAPTVIPGVDTLPLAQAQQAASAAEAGQQALANKDLGTAEADFRRATALDASNPNALAGLAQTLEREGKGRQAINVYRYLLYPKQGWGTSMERDAILRMHFTLLLVKDGQWVEAVSVYENTIGGIRLGSSFPAMNVHFASAVLQPALLQGMAHLVMGITYSNRLEHTQALTEYGAARDAQPSLALANYYYGLGLSRLGRRVEAKAAFEEAAGLGQDEVKAAAEEELKGFK